MKDMLLEPEETEAAHAVRQRRAARRRKEAQRRFRRNVACFLLIAAAAGLCVWLFFRPESAPAEPPEPPANVDTRPEPSAGTDTQPDTPPDTPPEPDSTTAPPDHTGTEPPELPADPDQSGAEEGEIVYVAIDGDALDLEVQKVLNTIVTDGMTQREQARAIFDFTRTSIAYTGDSDKSDWQAGAYDGLTKRRGDCFTYYAVSRAMFTALGIDNLEVQRVGGPTSHFWNLINCGDGWYHFDATPRSSKMPKFESFMFTDEEAADYTARAGRNYYTFDGSLYPERATGAAGEQAEASSNDEKENTV